VFIDLKSKDSLINNLNIVPRARLWKKKWSLFECWQKWSSLTIYI